MNKGIRLIKKMVALFLVLVLSIESFAAVVSDNDGSAFITKAEFDSLKNDFQRQIDQYNTSIDSKIDGAIASYLSGIKIIKKKEVKVLVNNIDVIRWAPVWKIYGSKKHWSDLNTYDEVVNKWFTPPAEQRTITRQRSMQLFNVMHWGLGILSTYMEFKLNSCSNGLMHSVQADIGSTGKTQSAPVFMVNAKKNEVLNGWEITNTNSPYINFMCSMPNFETTAYRDGQSGFEDWSIANYDAVAPADPLNLQIESEQNGYILRYSWDFNYQSSGGVWAGPRRGRSFVKAEYANFPAAYSWVDAFSDAGYAVSNKAVYVNPNGEPATMDFGNLYDIGVTWVKPNSSGQNKSNQVWQGFNYMLLGADNSDKVIIWSQMPKDAHPAYPRAYTDDTKFAIANCEVTRFNMSNVRFAATGLTNQNVSLSMPVDIKCPLWVEQKLADLYNPNFKVNDKPLKFGQGLPLVVDSADKGDLQVSLTVDTLIILGGTRAQNKIYLDMKKTDFLNNTDDYVYAYEGLVESETTSAMPTKIKRKSYTKTNTDTMKIDLTIPIKEGDSVWLRLCPQVDSGGIVSQIKSCNMYLVSNS